MKKYYFVGNAHLDPVWMWRWQEGSCEAKATIRSALDRMNEYPDFKFVCSSASVYKWVEDFAPDMFEEVKRRVNEGRFIIVGGQLVQPDCNLPSGEGVARQFLYSQRYFYSRFGKTAKSAYNVDSFGHSVMLPQIFKKSGLDHYVFMRPGRHEKTLPASVFIWRSPDGTEIPAYRIMEPYCYNMNTSEELEEKLTALEAYLPEKAEGFMLFYGVGNHGGGPTVKNIELILDSREKHPEREYIFSTVADYFEDLEPRLAELPVVEDDLQHHAPGCYSAVSLIKDLVRKGENSLLSAECAGMVASKLTGKKHFTKELEAAWQGVLFCHFHDIMGGCSVEDAYTDSSYMLGESIAVAERLKNSALQTVSWAIDTSDTQRGYPIVVFNTLPFEVEKTVQINSQADIIYDGNCNKIAHQHVQSQTHATRGRSDTIFTARVPAMGYATYYMKNGEAIADCDERKAEESALHTWENGMENEHLLVEFQPHTGHITRIFDKDKARELLSGKGAVPTVIDETGHDTWSHGKLFFTKEIAVFSDATVKVVENGPVRATIEVVSRYNGSTLTQYFSLTAGGRTLDVSAEIDWHEKHKMLKLAYETAAKEPTVLYEEPFGVMERPADGEEEPGYRWFALTEGRYGYAITNSNKYSFSAQKNKMFLTVVRSPLYGDHGRPANDRCRFTDQGAHRFAYSFLTFDTSKRQTVINEARMLNTPLDVVLENNHKGYLSASFEAIYNSADNVQISAIKRSEDGTGTVIRIYETDGRETDVTISGALMHKPLKVRVKPYSIDTYMLCDGADEWKEILITEL